MTGKGGSVAAAKPVVVEGKVKVPDLSRATDTIHKALGNTPGSAGQALAEGLMVVRDEVVGSVNVQLDGLRADSSAAKEKARGAEAKADEAAGHANSAAAEARDARSNAEGAATSAHDATRSAENAERAVTDVRDAVRSISITVGKETYTGEDALSRIRDILSSLVDISVKRGESVVTGVDAVRDVVATVEALEITRGASKLRGPDALQELVRGLGSIELSVQKIVEGKPSEPETVVGIDALIMLCTKMENLETGFAGRTDHALSDILSTRVTVGKEQDGSPKYETLTGSKLLMHVINVVDSLSESLSAETRRAVEETFTATATVEGKKTTLSGSALARYLVEIAETARAAAGGSIRRTEEAALKAQRSAEEARIAADGAYTASGEADKKADVLTAAVEVIDEKLAVLGELVADIARQLGVTEFVSNALGGTVKVSDVAALMAEPSIEKPDESGGKTG